MNDTNACKRRSRALAAFTLMEVMVASGVIGVIFVALYSGLAYGISSIRLSRENLRATQILAEKMDTFRLYTWSQITNGSFIPNGFTASYSPGSAAASQGPVYAGLVSIDTLDQAPDKQAFNGANYTDDMRKVTVTVNWQTGSIPRTRTLSTYVGRCGLQTYVY
jgi:prepilin-type N-terminal cleavage/methylation domain-containing protein